MFELTEKDCEKALPIVRGLDYNLSLYAVIEGTVLGEIWVDNAAQPRAVFALTPEAQYLAGDPGRVLCRGPDEVACNKNAGFRYFFNSNFSDMHLPF